MIITGILPHVRDTLYERIRKNLEHRREVTLVIESNKEKALAIARKCFFFIESGPSRA